MALFRAGRANTFASDDAPFGIAVVTFGDDVPSVLSLDGTGTDQFEVGQGQNIDCSMLASITAGRFDMISNQVEPDVGARVNGVLEFAEINVRIAQQAGVFDQSTYTELMKWGQKRPLKMKGEFAERSRELQRVRQACRMQDPASVSAYGRYIIGAKAVELLAEAGRLQL